MIGVAELAPQFVDVDRVPEAEDGVAFRLGLATWTGVSVSIESGARCRISGDSSTVGSYGNVSTSSEPAELPGASLPVAAGARRHARRRLRR